MEARLGVAAKPDTVIRMSTCAAHGRVSAQAGCACRAGAQCAAALLRPAAAATGGLLHAPLPCVAPSAMRHSCSASEVSARVQALCALRTALAPHARRRTRGIRVGSSGRVWAWAGERRAARLLGRDRRSSHDLLCDVKHHHGRLFQARRVAQVPRHPAQPCARDAAHAPVSLLQRAGRMRRDQAWSAARTALTQVDGSASVQIPSTLVPSAGHDWGRRALPGATAVRSPTPLCLLSCSQTIVSTVSGSKWPQRYSMATCST